LKRGEEERDAPRKLKVEPRSSMFASSQSSRDQVKGCKAIEGRQFTNLQEGTRQQISRQASNDRVGGALDFSGDSHHGDDS
jgi:hypothetical protein